MVCALSMSLCVWAVEGSGVDWVFDLGHCVVL